MWRDRGDGMIFSDNSSYWWFLAMFVGIYLWGKLDGTDAWERARKAEFLKHYRPR